MKREKQITLTGEAFSEAFDLSDILDRGNLRYGKFTFYAQVITAGDDVANVSLTRVVNIQGADIDVVTEFSGEVDSTLSRTNIDLEPVLDKLRVDITGEANVVVRFSIKGY